ncbi:MAG: rod shape-determining protein MreC [Bacilli bacterium]|nr:rod shape-determining protein MreC [Bacilli bacterium]
MRKKINGRKSKTRKSVVVVIIVSIFVFFISSCLVLANREYLFIEKGFKGLSGRINSFFINNTYAVNNASNNVVNAKNKELEKENNELRKTLGLKEINANYTTAEVVNHAAQDWFNKVDINKGYEDGVVKGLPVVNPSGLVGFISKTSKHVSEVKLLTAVNEDNMIPVMIDGSDGQVAGVLSEYDALKRVFKVTGVKSKNNVLKGANVVLSGYDNEAYKGIYVGKVTGEEISNHGLSKTIMVSTDVNFDDLMFVSVVRSK